MTNFLLILLTFALTSCFFGEKDLGTHLRGTASINPGITGEEELISSVGQKNYEQIIASISQNTGVTTFSNLGPNGARQERVDAVANSLSTLPDQHQAAKFNDAAQKSVFQVAAAYCDEMVYNQPILDSIFPNIGPINESLSTTQKNYLINTIAEKFWAGTASPEAIDQLKVDLGEMISDFQSSGSPKSALIFGACTYANSTANMVFN